MYTYNSKLFVYNNPYLEIKAISKVLTTAVVTSSSLGYCVSVESGNCDVPLKSRISKFPNGLT